MKKKKKKQIDPIFKQCPSCEVYVEKVAGCNLIRCRCKTRWCFVCGKVKEKKFKPDPEKCSDKTHLSH